ncbi:copper homeostasis protein CutC [Cohnella yongneupensis]|uniref:Copper homeostasis protein CutC n=1 Tax=Cohnella yongneupensis TaxID=425006 RepID=A0ABW0R327_9BACL
MIIEVIATSTEDILQAAAGGADRIELCAGLQEAVNANLVRKIKEISN